MLAAIPSVVLGLWGIFVLGPFLGMHVEPWLHGNLGFIPLFGAPSQAGTGLFTAGLILTIMVVPIIASICRELFLAVPRELEEGALALGTTRWEMVRGVVLPYTRSGIAAAIVLGLGRALGEAIAVTQVIGNAARDPLLGLRPGGHDRLEARQPVPQRDDEARALVALLPRGDPARHRRRRRTSSPSGSSGGSSTSGRGRD